MTINEYMTHDHRKCDDEFVDAENAISMKQLNAKELYKKFEESILRHFRMEEEVMFFEYNNVAQGMNPTVVMVGEHNQMRGVMSAISDALESGDNDKALGLMENLMFIIQQHNMKEEQMMYNLADRALDSNSIIERMVEVL